MLEKLELFIHFVMTLIKLLRPGGVKALVAENNVMRQQLIVLNRSRKHSPPLSSSDRFLFGFLVSFIQKRRLHKIAIILKPATLLSFHKALVNRKYSKLYSKKTKKTPGRKPQEQRLIDIVVEMKKRNPSFGYGRIAMQTRIQI